MFFLLPFEKFLSFRDGFVFWTKHLARLSTPFSPESQRLGRCSAYSFDPHTGENILGVICFTGQRYRGQHAIENGVDGGQSNVIRFVSLRQEQAKRIAV